MICTCLLYTSKEAYFLEDALKFREALPGAPLIYVGGLVSREKIDEVLDAGFDAVQMARALLNEPGFVNRMAREDRARDVYKRQRSETGLFELLFIISAKVTNLLFG